MKQVLSFLALFIIILSFNSCTKNEDYFLGVWENKSPSKVYTLVFGKNNTGLSIEKNINGSEITSSAVMFNWSFTQEEVLLKDGETLLETYTIDGDGQLVSNKLQFEKVSNDYSKYY